jgi:uncharacterized protein
MNCISGIVQAREGGNMQSSLELAFNNLTSVAVLLFALGFFASRINSDVRMPESVYQFISVFLLFGIGLKGGNALKDVTLSEFLAPSIATIVLGLTIPFLAFYALGFVRKLNESDRGAIAAHYGSTSLVTFTAALFFLEGSGIKVEGYATALLTIMEIPGIIMGIYLGTRHRDTKVAWNITMREVLAGKTVVLLVGGLLIGAVTTDSGYETVTPFFIDLQGGFLAFFLLHLGYLAGTNWNEIKHVGFHMSVFAIVFPIFMAVLGMFVANFVGLSLGGAVMLGVLCASASYIAAPAAVAVAIPEAKASLALVSSIGVTFPFNLIVGIPLYLEIARMIQG